MRGYYYALYKVYRLLQLTGPARYRSTLHFRAALLFAFFEVLVLVLPLLLVAGLQTSFEPVYLLGWLFLGMCAALTWLNQRLFRQPAWHRYLLEFRSLPRAKRLAGSVAVLVALLLAPLLGLLALIRLLS